MRKGRALAQRGGEGDLSGSGLNRKMRIYTSIDQRQRVLYKGYLGDILGLCGDSGKEYGNYNIMMRGVCICIHNFVWASNSKAKSLPISSQT